MFATKAKWAAKSGLYRKWLARKFLNDIPRFAKDKWEDFDPDDVLHRVGLTRYKPAKTGFGTLGVFILGACVGSCVALFLAPQPGTQLRTTVKDKAMGYLNRQNLGIGQQDKTAHA